MKKILFLLAVIFSALNLQAQQTDKSIISFDSKRNSDLNTLVDMIGDKRIVAIGEDTHGTKEYYELRTALTKKLITEKGFNVFILENPYEDMVSLQEDLYKQPLDTLISRHLFSIYQTKEMKNFLIWLKGYNRNHKIKLAGSDDSYREILPVMLKKELGRYNDKNLDVLAQDFEDRQLSDVEEYYTLPNVPKPDSLPDDIHFGYDTYKLLSKIDSLYRLKKAKSEKVEELIYEARSNYDIYWGFMNKKFLSRDEAMGNRVNYFARQKDAKIIIWANNAHIAKSSLDGEIGKMGETVAKNNLNQYVSIGLMTGSGTYSYINSPFINDDHNFSDTLFQAKLLPLRKGSWHEYLNNPKTFTYLLDFSKLNKHELNLYSIEKPFRAIGYKKENPDKTIFNTRLNNLFDIIVFYKNTTNTTPLFYSK